MKLRTQLSAVLLVLTMVIGTVSAQDEVTVEPTVELTEVAPTAMSTSPGEIPTLEPTVDPIVDEGEQTLIRELVLPLIRESLVPVIQQIIVPLALLLGSMVVAFSLLTGKSIHELSRSQPVRLAGSGASNLARLTPGAEDDEDIARMAERMGYRVVKTAQGWLEWIPKTEIDG